MKMKTSIKPSQSVWKAFSLGICLLSFLSACNRPDSLPVFGEAEGFAGEGRKVGVAILYPADGDQFQVGDFIDVHSQIGDPSGVTAAVLTANDLTLRRDKLVSPVAGGELYQPWVPDAPGTYQLQVILETSGGGQHISETVTVVVGDGPTLSFTARQESVTPTLESVTPTITQTLDITITATFTGTPETPTITSTSDKAMATGTQNSNCRKGPDTRYEVLGFLMEGETVPIVGRNSESSWWVVELTSPVIQCWVWSGGVNVSGSTAGVGITHPPKLPTFTFTPSNTPKPPTDTPKPVGPTYNACHDYPDLATCNSDPAGFGNCTWDTGMNQCKP